MDPKNNWDLRTDFSLGKWRTKAKIALTSLKIAGGIRKGLGERSGVGDDRDHDSVENCCAGNLFYTSSDLRQGHSALPFRFTVHIDLNC